MSEELEHVEPESESESESETETLERDERGRYVIGDAHTVVVPEPEPEPEPKPTPTSVSGSGSKPKRKAAPASALGAVTVSLSALVYHARSRNSASVAALQDRLTELGHGDARADIRGWLSDGTVKALADFQAASGLTVTGRADRETVEAILSGTSAVLSD